VRWLLLVLAVAATGVIGTTLVIAESRGRALLAGSCDAAGKLANIVYTASGVEALDHWGSRSALVLATVCGTAFCATTATTHVMGRVRAKNLS